MINLINVSIASNGRVISDASPYDKVNNPGIRTHNCFGKFFAQFFGTGTVTVRIDDKYYYLNRGSCFKLLDINGVKYKEKKKDFLPKLQNLFAKLHNGDPIQPVQPQNQIDTSAGNECYLKDLTHAVSLIQFLPPDKPNPLIVITPEVEEGLRASIIDIYHQLAEYLFRKSQGNPPLFGNLFELDSPEIDKRPDYFSQLDQLSKEYKTIWDECIKSPDVLIQDYLVYTCNGKYSNTPNQIHIPDWAIGDKEIICHFHDDGILMFEWLINGRPEAGPYV